MNTQQQLSNAVPPAPSQARRGGDNYACAYHNLLGGSMSQTDDKLTPSQNVPAKPAHTNGYCRICRINGIGKKRAAYGHTVCKPCGEKASVLARKSWCVLTPHKQGAMFFTADYAREAAIGINNKGGLTR